MEDAFCYRETNFKNYISNKKQRTELKYCQLLKQCIAVNISNFIQYSNQIAILIILETYMSVAQKRL